MRKKTEKLKLEYWQIILILLFAAFVFWCAFFFINVDINSNTAFVAAGALFTAWAFAATFFVLYKQHRDTIRATTLDVFTKTFEEIQNSKKYQEAKSYVIQDFSSEYEELKKSKGRSKNKENKITMTDFKNHCTTNNKCENTDTSFQKFHRNFFNNNFEKVIFFCTKMEYIGILVSKEYIDNIIVDYYGDTIIKSYKILKEILDNTREDMGEDGIFYLLNYHTLFCRALERETPLRAQSKEIVTELIEIEKQYGI